MKVEVGSRVIVKTYGTDPGSKTIYTVLEINGELVKLKHPDIGGYFGTKLSSIVEVIDEK